MKPAATEVLAATGGAPPEEHRTDTVERGSFCTAHCVCGWSGPARRSRDRARRDAAEHTAGTG